MSGDMALNEYQDIAPRDRSDLPVGNGQGVKLYREAKVALFVGKCEKELLRAPDNSVDSVVTDPPYELAFMGKKWDSTGIAFNVDMWREVLRVLKPGGHLLAFGGTRTYHRLAVAIEDAGFEIRDSIAWMYGSGMPKAWNFGTQFDGKWCACGDAGQAGQSTGEPEALSGSHEPLDDGALRGRAICPRCGGLRQEFRGFSTALKPAFEPIVVARKPLIGTVAQNVLAHGTGALNIDGCRVAHANAADLAESMGKNQHTRYTNPGSNRDSYSGNMPARTDYGGTAGRWPANVILDEHAAAELDAQTGVLTSGKMMPTHTVASRNIYGQNAEGGFTTMETYGDSGGASRFFYCAKAGKKERPVVNGVSHATVKPLALMRYLVRLVTPPGGTVLDHFAGSGTTIEAAILEGFPAIGIEADEAYIPLIEFRINRALGK